MILNKFIKSRRRAAALILTVLSFGISFVSNAQTPDPGVPGPHAVIKAEYNLGDTVYAPPSAAMFPKKMEVRGSVHYPSDLSSGPFPVLIWMHGRHSTCYNTTSLATSSAWPCPTGRAPILSYAGYDYAARTMASHGYIVISISANAINAIDGGLSDDGMNARGVLTQHHLDIWNSWSSTDTTGPFGSLFVGRLNMQKVGTMGHSRGGQGVVYHAAYNKSLGSPYGIKAVLTLAPVDFNDAVTGKRPVLNGIPLMNIAPYCDGDVSDLQGVHYYDDARYNDTTDQMPKHSVLMMGANHNYYNTVWTPGSWIAGGVDDWQYSGSDFDPHCGESAPGTGRLDTLTQQASYNTYAAAFYRLYIGNETKFAPILQTTDLIPPASSMLDSSQVFVSYHPGRTDRLDVNRIDTSLNTTVNTLTGAVTNASLTSPIICSGGLSLPACNSGLGTDQRPHRGNSTQKGLAQMKLTWSDTTAYYQNDLPAAYQDLSYYRNLTFRACENFSETTPGPDLDLTVQLIDSAGNKSSQVVNNHTNALFYEPGTESFVLPKVVFSTISIPLSSFTGINISKVRKVKFIFNKSTAGAILVTDLAFSNPVCGNLDAFFTDSIPTTGKKIFFINKSTSSTGDTLTRLWKFGDPASGVNDTSTLQNPNHTYAFADTYSVCLYLTVKRKNGLQCSDTFCKSVIRPVRVGIDEVKATPITIVPNPAKDFIEVRGVNPTDVVRIINLYGQEVLSANVTQARINLPSSLAPGIYYVIVVSPKGNVYQKLLITR